MLLTLTFLEKQDLQQSEQITTTHCSRQQFIIQGTGNPLFDDRKLVVDGVEEGLPLRSITFNVGIITSSIDTSYSVQVIDCLVLVYLPSGKSLECW